jgi:GNAT superfamily N-acetyltransferase
MRNLCRKSFLESPLWRPDRVHFACADDVPVSCAVAWEDVELWGERTGQLHWVATHPSHLRRGLARAAVLAALQWMRGSCDVAALITQTYRLPAIRLYLELGFVPSMDAFPEMPERWAQVKRLL